MVTCESFFVGTKAGPEFSLPPHRRRSAGRESVSAMKGEVGQFNPFRQHHFRSMLIADHTVRGMLTPWDATPPSELRLTCPDHDRFSVACPKGGNRKRTATVCPPQEPP